MVETLKRQNKIRFHLNRLNALTVQRFNVALAARQEGLEPPTDGFGDRYSTN
jgi:hypothetical protein